MFWLSTADIAVLIILAVVVTAGITWAVVGCLWKKKHAAPADGEPAKPAEKSKAKPLIGKKKESSLADTVVIYTFEPEAALIRCPFCDGTVQKAQEFCEICGERLPR